MNKTWKINDWQIAIGLALFCLLTSLVFFLPVINSDDDFFLMYQLGGGFGEAPSNLLHFDHVIHPWLGYILSRLFINIRGVNWYTWFFISCQFISWILIGRLLLLSFKRITAILVFVLLFVLAGINSLQSLNMTSTTWLLSIAAMSWMVCQPRAFIFCFLILLLAGSIRMQIPLIVGTLFLPLQWVKAKRLPWKPILFLAALTGILFLLNWVQKKQYAKNIPGWETAESRRQDLFYAFNRPRNLEKADSLIFINAIEKQVYDRVFFYDEGFPSKQRLAQISRASVRMRDLSQNDDFGALHWTWVAWRLYLLYFLIAVLLAWRLNGIKDWLKNIWLPLLGIIGFYAFLFIFLKFTEAFFMGIILMMAIQMTLLWPHKNSPEKNDWLTGLLFLLPMAWSLSRDISIDKQNHEGYRQFSCGAKEIAGEKQHLFISTGEGIPVKYFKYNELPAAFSLENYVFKERVLTESFSNSFKKYGITGSLFQDLTNPSLIFTGPAFPQLTDWANKNGYSIYFSAPDNSYGCLEARRILVK